MIYYPLYNLPICSRPYFTESDCEDLALANVGDNFQCVEVDVGRRLNALGWIIIVTLVVLVAVIVAVCYKKGLCSRCCCC